MIPETIATDVLQNINTQQAWHYMILPYHQEGQMLKLYVSNEQFNDYLEEELEVLLGCGIDLTQVNGEQLRKEIAKYYRKPNDSRSQEGNSQLEVNDSQHLLIQLIKEAKSLGSSDIHLEPYEHKARVRIRIDGKLIERYELDKGEYPSLVNKIKIRSNLDIAEKRLPQDGRIFFQSESLGRMDVRVSVLPTLHGEKIVLRILGNDAGQIQLESLGFSQQNIQHYLEGIIQPNGMVLISGPTGSGKTTTLYATLQMLNESVRNILTIEDPIEYTLEGINQVQLRENIGLDFPSAMRTFLRQDPDVIMVGEIRDQATAAMAIRASLTGHLVLSTIHTNSAWGIVARLIDMGIPAYLLADTLNTAVAQRLLRVLCEDCKTAVPFDPQSLPRGYSVPHHISQQFSATGCESCYYTGYRGRTAIYEVIPIDMELANQIKNSELNVNDLLKAKQIGNLADQAFALLASGKTSAEEIYSILLSS
ncbi:MAG: GspE/PulE family protein [Bacteroidota bacterium]